MTTDVALRTLLLTDLVGSTRLIETLGDERAAEAFRQHDDNARALLVDYHGREIDKTDGFLFLFERPVDAVRYALAYHRGMKALGLKLDIDLQARAGIHLGEVVLRENSPEAVARGAKPLEVEGLAKPQAARAMALAVGRQTLLTRAAFDIARRAWVGVKTEGAAARWVVHGAYRFKGIEDPVEICEVGEEGLAPLAPPPDGEKAARVRVEGEEPIWRPAAGLGVPNRQGWVLEKQLGVGGFGDVWLAQRGTSGTRRVFKFSLGKESVEALRREVALIQKIRDVLGHRPDIAKVVDWQLDEAPYYLELDYEPGGSLVDWCEGRGGVEQLPMEMRVDIAAQVADALAAAHSVGIAHKDVKPSNVLVRNDPQGKPHIVLTDFGVAAAVTKQTTSHPATDGTGGSTGTQMYIAPEVLEGEEATELADIYALGVVLYQLARGSFRKSLSPGWERHVADDRLREQVSACVQGAPADRLGSARELAERLRSLDAVRTTKTPSPAAAPSPAATLSPAAAPHGTTTRPPGHAPTVTKPSGSCGSCGGELGEGCLRCPDCGDAATFCSKHCFEVHGTSGHCGECRKRLGEEYLYSDLINAAVGERRFCSSDCSDRHVRRLLCAQCNRALSQQFLRNAKAESALGHEARFCSDACVQTFVQDRLCSNCSRGLPPRHFTCATCGPTRRLCSQACAEDHHARTHR